MLSSGARKNDPVITPDSASQRSGIPWWQPTAVCLALATLVWIVFGQTAHYGFVNYDDGDYVYERPIILKGLTMEGFRWAFTHSHSSNWHPVTTLSHMLDCQIFKDAGEFHLTNVILHAAGAMVLFLVLRQMTGAFWRSAFVAAVFAIHPLRVESVAWISERKDVLSGVFFMLTLGAYASYSRKRTLPRYLAVAFLFAVGLMCKPTLVTVPLVLLLLDYWPLGRFTGNRQNEATGWWRSGPQSVRLVVEKIPFLLLSAGSCVATVLAQKTAIESVEITSFTQRVANALASYAVYIGQIFYPVNLAVFYPRAGDGPPLPLVVSAAVQLAVVTGVAFAWRRKRPWFIAGWLWYLGMLVPMIGIMQVGAQAHADRYTYLPQIGLCIIIAWGAAEFLYALPRSRLIAAVAGSVTMVALSALAWKQTNCWRNSETLWTHTLACTSKNAIAHCNYGLMLFTDGRVDDAIAHYKKALEYWPDYADAHANYAIALTQLKQYDEAISHYEAALLINPDFPEVHNDLANVYYQKNDLDEAAAHSRRALELKPDYADALCTQAMTFARQGDEDDAIAGYQKALQLRPDSPEARNNYASLLIKKGDLDGAIAQCRRALELSPNLLDAHCNLAVALTKKGLPDEAALHYRKALELRPDSADGHNNLANIFDDFGQGDAALAQYERAVQIDPAFEEAHYNLGIDLSSRGEWKEAISHYRKALEIASSDIRVQSNLAWILATCPDSSLRDGSRAVELARRADGVSGSKNPSVLRTLAAAYAEAGRFGEALDAANHALALATAADRKDIAGSLRADMELYRSSLPLGSENK